MEAGLYLVGTPIGNLQDLTLRALETLKSVDVIYCEDTRRSLKLLNAFEIRKPLKSCPHFKEKQQIENILNQIRSGERVAYISDAGMPGLNDPGELLVAAVREANLKVHIIGGVSALTYFVAGLGCEISSFRFVGFLPPRLKDREAFFRLTYQEPVIFMESTHRIEATLKILAEIRPSSDIIFAKELSKMSERFFCGKPESVLKEISSFKGEWMGCLL